MLIKINSIYTGNIWTNYVLFTTHKASSHLKGFLRTALVQTFNLFIYRHNSFTSFSQVRFSTDRVKIKKTNNEGCVSDFLFTRNWKLYSRGIDLCEMSQNRGFKLHWKTSPADQPVPWVKYIGHIHIYIV